MKTQKQTFTTPSSLEAATKEVKRAKSVIKSKQDELENIKVNGFTYNGSLELSNYDSFSEIISAVSDLMKKHGDLKVEWVGDIAEYSYLANIAETDKIVAHIEYRITELQEQIDFLMVFISEKMEQIKIDIDMKNYMSA